ncbi:MAG: AAA family ATPase [Verrucomicrobiae bacterium]|nr:AAA family ATPase [Verrucomicrobiae bacterium]
MPKPKPLKPSQLHRNCPTSELPFKSTSELQGLQQVPGQRRALEAIEFGIRMKRYGYNLFAMSSTGSGKHRVIRRYLEKNASDDPSPNDWIYVSNFDTEYQPRAIAMKAGTASEFRDRMKQLIDDLKTALPATFETDDYRAQRTAVEQSASKEERRLLEQLRDKAAKDSIVLVHTQSGPAFAPAVDGEPIETEAYKALADSEKKRIQEVIKGLQSELEAIMHQMPKWRREIKHAVQALNRKVVHREAKLMVREIRENYTDQKDVQHFLDLVLADIEACAEEFLPADESTPSREQSSDDIGVLYRYRVNVLVEHAKDGNAPIVYEDNPTYPNLVGRIEHFAEMGTLMTDFTLIKPGALHRANGGYLVIDARQLLPQPFAWDVLKRALRNHQIRTESLAENYTVTNTVSLQPEPVPLNVKVILLGERHLYYALHRHDSDFSELFKVVVDFEEEMPWNKSNVILFARLIANFVSEQELLPFDRSAIARMVENVARQADDSTRLSLHAESLKDLAVQADYQARQANSRNVIAAHIDAALDAHHDRCGRIEERLHERILDGTMAIRTSGEAVGQINGLSVMHIGESTIGQPHRITARIRKGSGRIINIEREVNLSGPIHSKGVLILSSYLASTFLPEKDLNISASLVFEQSYGGIDGDSASSTELYALLSAISGIPVRQSLAVTGSVNQFGEVQAIGGANAKIEGFFKICKERGLTGNQGVLIPKTNVRNLMLSKEVVDAATAGKFSIYPVATIEEGIELLTGVRAGKRLKNGKFTTGSVFAKVEEKLISFHARDKKNAEKTKADAPEKRDPTSRSPKKKRPVTKLREQT